LLFGRYPYNYGLVISFQNAARLSVVLAYKGLQAMKEIKTVQATDLAIALALASINASRRKALADHRRANPSEKVTVTSSQTS
jgi:hypothetical protein